MFGLSKELENIWRTVCVRVFILNASWWEIGECAKNKLLHKAEKTERELFFIFFVFCFLKIYAATICCQLVHNFYESFR